MSHLDRIWRYHYVKLITDKDNTEEEITQEMVEDWMGNVIDKRNEKLTKSKLIDMVKSIERITETIAKNKLIGIIADYDVDGSTSAAILCKFFKSINQKVILKIPNRLQDGFGPNEKILDEMLENKTSPFLGMRSFNSDSEK